MRVTGDGELDEAMEIKLQEQRRFRKMGTWLRSPCTRDKLLSLCIALKDAIPVLATHFKGARKETSNTTLKM